MNFKPSSKYRIGIIGKNFGLATVAPAILGSNSFDLACMADSSTPSVRGSIPGSNIPMTSWPALIADPMIDIVWVATPPSTHFQLVRSALLSGKMVICEKPAGVSIQEASDLRELSIELNLPIFLDFEFRYDPIYTNAFENASGIPEDQFFEFVIYWQTFARKAKRVEVNRRAIFLDFGIHVLDCLLHFAKSIGTTFVRAEEEVRSCSVCATKSQSCTLFRIYFVRFAATVVICRNYPELGVHRIDLRSDSSVMSWGIKQPYSSNDLFFEVRKGCSSKSDKAIIFGIDSFCSDMRIYSVGLLLMDIEKFLSGESTSATPPVIEDALTVHKVIDGILGMGED